MQSLREVPGFLAFTAVFVLLALREQTFALAALCVLGIGTALTGFFPSVIGLYATTVLMSLGFHYFETVRQSLALQWVDKANAPHFLGQMIAAGSIASLAAFALIYLALDVGGLDMRWVYVLGGGATVGIVIAAWMVFPRFRAEVEQHKHLVLRRRYWLYYALVFMSGARRQIFVVFAGFLMVERFGFGAAEITLMFLVNSAINIVAAPRIGKLIARWGERRALGVEYLCLIAVFVGYALVQTAWVAVGLYILDHMIFAMAIAIKTYFQKIADPADIASTAGVSFNDQPHRGGDHSRGLRLLVGDLAGGGVPGRRRHGRAVAGTLAMGTAGAGPRDGGVDRLAPAAARGLARRAVALRGRLWQALSPGEARMANVAMETRRIGRTAIEVTAFGAGGFSIGNLWEAIAEEAAREAIDSAYGAGIRYFDTAPEYGYGLSERRFGDALRTRPRDDYVLSTKVGLLLKPRAGALPPDDMFVDPLRSKGSTITPTTAPCAHSRTASSGWGSTASTSS